MTRQLRPEIRTQHPVRNDNIPEHAVIGEAGSDGRHIVLWIQKLLNSVLALVPLVTAG